MRGQAGSIRKQSVTTRATHYLRPSPARGVAGAQLSLTTSLSLYFLVFDAAAFLPSSASLPFPSSRDAEAPLPSEGSVLGTLTAWSWGPRGCRQP